MFPYFRAFRRFLLAVALAFLSGHRSPAAMLGDFGVPGPLLAGLETTAEGCLFVRLAAGGEMTLCLGEGEPAREPDQVFPAMAEKLSPDSPILAADLGGRPLYGNLLNLSGGVALFRGFVQRNGIIYPVNIILKDACFPDGEIRRLLSRIHLLPGLRHSPAAEPAVLAADWLANGGDASLPELVRQIEILDWSGWAAPYYRGRLAESEGDYHRAENEYALALTRMPLDLETAARHLGAGSLAGEFETGAASLYDQGLAYPADASAWEELAKIYLQNDDSGIAGPYLEAALAANPVSAASLASLANILADAGDYAGAFRLSRALLNYRPDLPMELLPDLSDRAAELEPLLPELLSEPLPVGGPESFLPAPAVPAAGCLAGIPLPDYVKSAPLVNGQTESLIYWIQPPPVYVEEPLPAVRESRIHPVFKIILDLFASPPHRRGYRDRNSGRPEGSGSPARPEHPGRPGNRPKPGRPGGSDRPSPPPASPPARPEHPDRPGNRPESGRPGNRPEPGRPGGSDRPSPPASPGNASSGIRPLPAPGREIPAVSPPPAARTELSRPTPDSKTPSDRETSNPVPSRTELSRPALPPDVPPRLETPANVPAESPSRAPDPAPSGSASLANKASSPVGGQPTAVPENQPASPPVSIGPKASRPTPAKPEAPRPAP
ncbi:MAG: hypothetical protein LBU64_12060, partial [Planctomycetota bacterium]|nr:hypothetical protein [Planctomycetota bacterium]